MEGPIPRTESVRRALEDRRFEPDGAYAHDLLQLERLAALRPLGFASSLALANLMSRYPREADAIVHELGVRAFAPLEDERMRALVEERLRLAEMRERMGRLRPQESLGLFDF